jgi:predicted metalloprotease
MGQRRGRGTRSAIALGLVSACVAAALTGCVSTVDGRAVSMLYDPWRVGGLPATDGPSGPRDNEAAPAGVVENTDGGEIDRLALLSVNDIGDYWKQNYDGPKGAFTPIDTLISYGSADPAGLTICGVNTYQFANAFYCYGHNTMAWDREVLFPAGKRYFGDMAITAALAHEYGHAVQDMANLVDKSPPTLVAEQQADCFAGAYLRWVAEGNSPRFTVNTAAGLNGVLAGLIALRDPVPGPHGEPTLEAGHGTALDRIGAFQMGFGAGTATCFGIDTADIEHRRGSTAMLLQSEPSGRAPGGEAEIDRKALSTLMEALNTRFSPAQPPTLSFEDVRCPDGNASPPASYCPATNTISVDLPELQQLGSLPDETENKLMLHGENTAVSVVMSRYMLALQHERGLELTSATAGLRTACLTGLGQRTTSGPGASPDGTDRKLSAEDLDQAVTGLLTNGLAASGIDGAAVPAGFTRIQAFRSGLLGDAELCYQRFR